MSSPVLLEPIVSTIPTTLYIPQPTFSMPSLIIGLLIGMIVMLAIFWFLYYSRALIFSTCPLQTPFCVQNDYVNNPGEALTQGAVLDDILSIKDGVMYYKRVQANSSCVPQSNQTIAIENPQYCQFSNGTVTATWMQDEPGSSVYSNGMGMSVSTSGNCIPLPGEIWTTGTPSLKWDPSPLL
jgi:hypothetical protein